MVTLNDTSTQAGHEDTLMAFPFCLIPKLSNVEKFCATPVAKVYCRLDTCPNNFQRLITLELGRKERPLMSLRDPLE